MREGAEFGEAEVSGTEGVEYQRGKTPEGVGLNRGPIGSLAE